MVWRRHDDKDFLTKMWEMLDEADAILSYNGRRFDIPTLNREFVKAGMPPPSPYKHIDLMETVKRVFKFPSNKLQFVAGDLEIGSKMAHEGFGLWIKCKEGDEKAWATMERYNRQDVLLLDVLYNRIKPWIKGHPNAGVGMDLTEVAKRGEYVCSTCGSTHVQQRGFYHTQAATFKRYKCNACSSWSRARYAETKTQERRHNLTAAT